MAEVRIDENGNLINVETGENLGNVKQNVNFNSQSAQLKSLQEMGVGLPEFPDDEDDEEEKNIKSNNISLSSNDILKSNHTNYGETTFKYKQSKYHVNENSYFVIKFGLLMMEDGRFIPISYESTDDVDTSEKHWVKFRMWHYREELQWKQNVMEYNSNAKIQIMNQDKLNEIKIKKLMLDWSFGEEDNNLKLLHCDGKLSDESYDMFMSLHPSIARTIVDLMNMVLENNQ